MADFPIRELHQRNAFEFPPTTSTEPLLKILPLSDGKVRGYQLDVLNISEEVEIHLHNFNLAPPDARPQGEPVKCLTVLGIAAWDHVVGLSRVEPLSDFGLQGIERWLSA